MAISFLNLNDNPLQMFRILIGIIQGQGEILALQILLVDDRHRTIDSHRVIDARDEEEQSYMGIAIEVLVRLKQPVAGDVWDQEVSFIKHLDESRLAALGGGVAATILITAGHDHE